MSESDSYEVNPFLPDDYKIIIADLVLAWARFDALMSQLLILVFDLDLDTGAILIGNMDTSSKFDRIIKVYKHHGLSGADKMKELQKLHKEHVDLRNSVCHAGCGGTLKSDSEKIVFAPVRQQQGMPGNMMIEVHHVSSLIAATAFAYENGNQLNIIIQHFSKLRAER